MRRFTYHQPTNIDEGLSLLSSHGADAKVIAGGQSLLPMMAMRLSSPAHLIDVARMGGGLDTIGADDGSIGIGANVSHSSVAASQMVEQSVPLLTRAAPMIGHRAIRNRGTLCGSIAHADPAAEWPAVALALDAEIVASSVTGSRVLRADEFFLGFLTTRLRDEELVTEVRFPFRQRREGSAIHELSRRHGDFAMCGAVARLRLDPAGVIEFAAVACFGVASTPVRMEEAEAMLLDQPPSADLFGEAAAMVAGRLDPPSDVHATAPYRKHIAGVLARRALVDAGAEATSDIFVGAGR